VPVQPLPSVQKRARYFSEQVKEWLADPKRTDEQRAAFWVAVGHLKDATFGAVELAPSFVYRDYFYATMATGEIIMCRFGILPPVLGVFLLYVGAGDEVAEWKPAPDGLS
jgi:hypothetical protein